MSGIYFAAKDMLASKQLSTYFCTSHITHSESGVYLLTSLITAGLSYKNKTLWFLNRSCHKQITTKTGNNSRKVRFWGMPEQALSAGHPRVHHQLVKNMPKPELPAALECTCRVTLSTRGVCHIPTPLKRLRNWNHTESQVTS